MNIFEMWLLGYLSIALAKFVLLLPCTIEHAIFMRSLEEIQSNVWLVTILMVFAYVITSLQWPRVLYTEKLSFFTYQPFDENEKQEILAQLKERNRL
ncbi:hypothetical protein SAMN05216262_110124 [Colwellia chukchiensis]|uniref:Uncharacterized protein n=1 Tax=Colwellia chukchiensis TaxID=641665 RepID=A0A1H7Q266_9GAMM|nr:hypothetical protein [Colwellia chukchiensis]SEL42102.1 hypothetical protein SAMN05216262_110124 [Colwellia chukchiensis]